jgi:sporulation protein YlmC with PRC-barrel domain
MEIEYGSEVIDRDGKMLGTVDYIMRNTWTGEISKFMVRRKPPDNDLFFSLDDVLEVAKSKTKVNILLEELSGSR